jgi:hypothetical protein
MEDTETTDAVGFEINEPVEVGDMKDVQQDILPVCQNVKAEIKKASIAMNKDHNLKYIKLELQLVDGIPTQNDDGETEYRYRNKTVFPGMLESLIWADPVQKTSDYFKKRQYLLPFKEFCKALDLEGSIVVNDDFLTALVGRHILFSVKHEANRVLDADGSRIPDGTFRERVYGWKRAVEE